MSDVGVGDSLMVGVNVAIIEVRLRVGDILGHRYCHLCVRYQQHLTQILIGFG